MLLGDLDQLLGPRQRRQPLGDLGRRDPQPARQLGGLHSALSRLLHPEGEGGREVLLQRGEGLLEDCPAVAPPARVEDLAAAERRGRRGAAEDEAVPPQGRDGRLEADLDRAGLTGSEPLGVERAHAAEHLARVEMEAHGDEAAHGRRRVRQQGEASEQAGGDLERLGEPKLHAAGEVLQGHAGELERGALPGVRPLARLAVHLDATHPDPLAARQELQRVSRTDRAARQRAGHHHA